MFFFFTVKYAAVFIKSVGSCSNRYCVTVPAITSVLTLCIPCFTDENYLQAEALIMTFSLNNYPREDPKFKVVLEWEQYFLDIVQAYQKDPKTNFTFAYMAEVSKYFVFSEDNEVVTVSNNILYVCK